MSKVAYLYFIYMYLLYHWHLPNKCIIISVKFISFSLFTICGLGVTCFRYFMLLIGMLKYYVCDNHSRL